MSERVSHRPRTGDELQWEDECRRVPDLHGLMVVFRDPGMWARTARVMAGLDTLYDTPRAYDWEQDGI